eukprot:3525790-Ditylum_brightwellii.AAC.1
MHEEEATADSTIKESNILNIALLSVGSWDTAKLTSLIQNGEQQQQQQHHHPKQQHMTGQNIIHNNIIDANTIKTTITSLTLSNILTCWTYVYK